MLLLNRFNAVLETSELYTKAQPTDKLATTTTPQTPPPHLTPWCVLPLNMIDISDEIDFWYIKGVLEPVQTIIMIENSGHSQRGCTA